MHDVHHILTSPIPCRLITLGLDQDGMHVWWQTWRPTVGPQTWWRRFTGPVEDIR